MTYHYALSNNLSAKKNLIIYMIQQQCLTSLVQGGTCKMRNETKRNEIYRNEINRNETDRNKTKRNNTK